ncbi:unnamed protein product [Paramecium sonneborni]|uniref:Uncharacterized protein n=1 Tax=Paramecium sonneborni TaxID=65129 RepID=A0A8S1QUY7_9CILI|nr:unnamed protein product [Paramecium sonneborni]
MVAKMQIMRVLIKEQNMNSKIKLNQVLRRQTLTKQNVIAKEEKNKVLQKAILIQYLESTFNKGTQQNRNSFNSLNPYKIASEL